MTEQPDLFDDPTPGFLLATYKVGMFPMGHSRESEGVSWYDPEHRAVIPLDAFHVPRSLEKTIRRGKFEITVDTAFRHVIDACAAPGPGREQTWISRKLERLYVELHEADHAHSVECWCDGQLVGGLYGVSVGGAFFGESMFSRERDASKVALVHLVERLARGHFDLLEIQYITPHLSQFGAIEVSRSAYHKMLVTACMNKIADFRRYSRESTPLSSRHSITQIS